MLYSDLDFIGFYLSDDDVMCSFDYSNIETFKTLVYALFRGALSDKSLDYIVDTLTPDKPDDALEISKIKDMLVSQPVISPINFK